MLHTIVKKGRYQDSVVLMLLTNQISAMDGVKKVSIMMGTPANKEIFLAGGLKTPELMEASANDMVIVADTENESVLERLETEAEEFLKKQAKGAGNETGGLEVKSWEAALDRLPEANLAVISIPGAYAAAEADRALEEGLHVFLFSDNVSVEEEVALKQKAHEKGLLVMGPDCGTGIIKGVPIAFTNHVAYGGIGIVGASGTGIQELTAMIDRMGEGVTNAIGTGGRDLSERVGGITMLDAIEAMEQDKDTKVIIVLSKPPAREVRDRVMNRIRSIPKPVVTLFLGEKPDYHEENLYHAYTLDEAARTAVQLLRQETVREDGFTPRLQDAFEQVEGKAIRGYYSGGTLAAEAAMMIRDALKLPKEMKKKDGFMLKEAGHVVVDLGDDVYTQGTPHPMIDPRKRLECMETAAEEEATGVILFDVILGYGSHEDMAKALLPGIRKLQEQADRSGRKLHFVATVCGTMKDVQGYEYQVKLLKDAGVIVCDSNKRAVITALGLIGYSACMENKKIRPRKAVAFTAYHPVSPDIQNLLTDKPKVINIGLKSFATVLREFSCDAVQYNWTPPAGGNANMIRALQYLRNYRFPQEVRI